MKKTISSIPKLAGHTIVSILLLCMIMTLLPMAAAQSSGNVIDVGDSTTTSGTGWTYSDGVFRVTGDVTITGTTTTNRIVVQSGANVNITLNNVSINRDADTSQTDTACAFDMTGAVVNLTITGENTLRSGHLRAGLQVPPGANLTIGGTGRLVASSHVIELTSGGAGIGGGVDSNLRGQANGMITINSGTIVSTGGHLGAGIGGSCGSDYQNSAYYGGSITINGGHITATGGDDAAGIGGGFGSVCESIIINDGTIIATGGGNSRFFGGAGIGNGAQSRLYNLPGGNITINGGNITATGGGNLEMGGAGIGGGYNSWGGNITINGGTVTANGSGSTNAEGGAGIGSGILLSYSSGGGSNIVITGGFVTAVGYNGPGFGAGSNGAGCSLRITGGDVTAQSGAYPAFASGLALTMPTGYTFWTNTQNTNPGGSGTEFPPTPYSFNSAHKFVRVQASTPEISLGQTGTYAFPDAFERYAAQEALSVIVSSTGKIPTGDLSVTLSGATDGAEAFSLSKAAIGSIAPGETDSFTVVPVTGLSAGEYSATITVSGDDIEPKSFEVTFTVHPTYTVVFMDWDNAELDTQYINKGSAATAPDDPMRPGYIFTGWDKDFSNVTSNLTVNAMYRIDIIPVTDITDVPILTKVGTPLALTGTVVPSSATYKEVKWSIVDAGDTGATIENGELNFTAAGTATVRAVITDGVSEGTDFSKDFEIVAVPPTAPFTVSFNANGGVGIMEDAEVGSGEEYHAPTSGFIRANHTFAFWNTKPNGSGTRYIVGEMITTDDATITLYALWIRDAIVAGPGPIIVPGW